MKLFDQSAAKPVKQEIPLVPLRELVVFPHMISPFFVGRSGSVKAVEEAMEGDRLVFLAVQKGTSDDPDEDDLHPSGTVAHILQLLRLPDGTLRILVEGKERAVITRFVRKKDPFRVAIRPITEDREVGSEVAALMRTVQDVFKRYVSLQKKITSEIAASVEKAEYPDKLVDLIAAQVGFPEDKKIELLSETSAIRRLEILAVTLEAENEVLGLQQKIHLKVKKRMEKSQREYYLNEQLKEIHRELGNDPDDQSGVKELESLLLTRSMPDEVREKAQKELKRLSRLQPMSPEAGVLRTYVEWIADLPWLSKAEENRDLAHAAAVLDEDHYDMKKPKDRILDFIAVHQLDKKSRGAILCLVGPPGTGKTSLGKSVARALGRPFVRISLGGVRDEAEIRGHRKTYVGSLPGKIIQSMKKAGYSNPVFLLDEIDKMSSDFRGDPAAALLEVLDPEQNGTFTDHYLELPYDLSDVMFITTANSLHTIPFALRDRMEVIEIPGYTEFEKIKIAQRFIIPKQLALNGLAGVPVTFHETALKEVIDGYTMESGVRNLEREIAAILRKTARRLLKHRGTRPAGDAVPEGSVDNKGFSAQITTRTVHKYLGNPRFHKDNLDREPRAGMAFGLAWTEVGGTVLPVEVALLPGTGELILTGSLGDVMKESVRIALSFLRSQSDVFALDISLFKERDIHIHVPEGAIPKDGPSAGITMTAAILSSLTSIPVKPGFAMTGEVTLTGRVLPIGGLKEKTLAAHRNKMTDVLIPEQNRSDIDELPREVLGSLVFHPVSSIAEALRILFPEELFLRVERKRDETPVDTMPA